MKPLFIEHFNPHLSRWCLGIFAATGELLHHRQQALLKTPHQQLCIATANEGTGVHSLAQYSVISCEIFSQQRDLHAQNDSSLDNKLPWLAARRTLRKHRQCSELSQWRNRFDHPETRKSL